MAVAQPRAPTGGARPVSIRVVGCFEARVDGRLLARADWQRVSAERLVKLLAVTPGHRVRREAAAETLWPEASPAGSRASLRKAILFARRALAPSGALEADKRDVGLDPDRVDLDLDRLTAAFDSLVARHLTEDDADEPHEAYQLALDLGSAELLPDDPYEDWLVAPRERLAGRWLAVALSAARRARDDGRTAAAHDILDRLLDRDPTDEAAHRLAIELYAAEGRHHAARRQYDACRRALREYLDADPSPETDAVLRAAERTASSAESSPLPAARLVARRAELERIEPILDGVASGRVRGLVIRGAAGIGKTRLLEEVASYARAAGWRVVGWQASASMDAVAYAPLRFALPAHIEPGEIDGWPEPARSGLATILPGFGRPAVMFADHVALQVALVAALERLAATRPFLLAVDDLPFLDASSIGLLRAALAGLRDTPLMLAATCRDDEPVGADARDLSTSVGAAGIELTLGPLGPRDVERLVVEQLGGESVDGTLARWIHEQGRGNPLFCLEVARLARDRGTIARERGRWTVQAPPLLETVPPSALRLVADRVARLPASTRSLLGVAAELPPRIGYSVLKTVDRRPRRTLADIDAALASGLLVERGGAYAFGHPLYRLAIREAAGSARRSSVDLRIAQALAGIPWSAPPDALERTAATSPNASAVAGHALTACELGDDRARPLAVAFAFAAAAAERRLFDRAAAISLLERGLAAWRSLSPDEQAAFDAGAALVALAELRSIAGNEAAATPLFREAITAARTPREVARAYDAFHWLPYGHGDFEAAVALLEEGLAALPPDADTERALLRRGIGWCLSREGRIGEGLRLLEDAARILGASGERAETMKTLDLFGDLLGLAKRTESAIDTLGRSLALALELGDSRGEVLARIHLGGTLTSAGRPERARPHLERALELARLAGDRYVESVGAWMAADMQDALGDLPAAMALLRRELELLGAIGGNPRNEAVAHAHLATLARRAGDEATAGHEAVAARSAADRVHDGAFAATIEGDLQVECWSEAKY